MFVLLINIVTPSQPGARILKPLHAPRVSSIPSARLSGEMNYPTSDSSDDVARRAVKVSLRHPQRSVVLTPSVRTAKYIFTVSLI